MNKSEKLTDDFIEQILDEAKIHYNVNLFTKDRNWVLHLKDDNNGSTVWSGSAYQLKILIQGLKIFLDSNQELYKIEEEIAKNKADKELNEYHLKKELERAKLRRKYASKIFIPMEPLNKNYVSCNFATYAKCPTCGATVQDGMGHKDEQCPECTQLLKW